MNAENKGKVVVVGAGLMGTGIAHAFASSGFETVLVDTNSDSLKRAYAGIEKILGDGVRLGKVEELVAQQSNFSRLVFGRNLSARSKFTNA